MHTAYTHEYQVVHGKKDGIVAHKCQVNKHGDTKETSIQTHKYHEINIRAQKSTNKYQVKQLREKDT